MCFSAQASFTGGAVITAIGIATLAKAEKPAQIPFASIPLIFGIQQCAEGVLWITLRSDGYERLQNAATYIFLITALVIWPTMMPLSIRLMEKVKPRKIILAGLIAIGGLLSLYYAYCLLFYNVTPQIQSFHINYVNDFPGALVKTAFVVYMAAPIAPLFVSTVKRMWLFGILVTVSCIVTGIFFAQYLTSVWCFFAAMISITIYWVLSGARSEVKQLSKEIRSIIFPANPIT
ncbi:MAG: DUF6629 family protein [Dehalococcoidales bacterium]|jgi:hypothetical protein